MIAAGLAVIGTALVGPRATGTDAEDTPLWRGRWNTEAELTIEPRTGAAVAVAPGIPHGVVVWGGVAGDGRLLNDGVLIDSGDPYRWRVMPGAPLVARRDFGWASDGDRVYIWGGVGQDGVPLDDGAEFQHGWTMLPKSRLPPGPASMAIADGRLWVVAADPETGTAKIESTFVPVEDRHGWGLVADVPLPVGDRYAVVGCCGDEASQLIVFSIREEGFAVAASWDIGAARNPSFIGGDWTQLGPVPVPIAGPVTGRAIEQELAAWVSSVESEESGAGESGAVAVLRQVAYGADDEWRTPLAPGGLDVASNLVLSSRHLISVSDLAAYDLAEERWLRLPERHRRASFGTPTGATAWWDRGRLWVIGGEAPDDTMRSDLWTFTPRLPKDTYALPVGWLPLWRGTAGSATTRAGRGRGGDGVTHALGPKLTITDSTGTVRFTEGETCQGSTGTGG